MVDGMTGCDALHVAERGPACVGIVTDDDDLPPAALSAYRMGAGGLAWIRTRSAGLAMNDPSLLNAGLRIHRMGVRADV